MAAGTLKHILDAQRKAPTALEIAKKCKRRHNTASTDVIGKLTADIRPLFMFPMRDSDLHIKVLRQTEAHISRIFGVS